MKFLERTFFRRPRILNQLHRLRLIDATSQTNEDELAALSKYARGKHRALEIGTYQGVSAARIANVLAGDGRLYCVDPWPESRGKPNRCYSICLRHLKRTLAIERIEFLRGTSGEVRQQIPENLDFAFVDGDHSWSGIETDWQIILEKLAPGGIACFHDSFVPAGQEWRRLDSSRFFAEVIATHPEFQLLDSVFTLAVVQRKPST